MKRLLILTVVSFTALSFLGAQAKEPEELEMVQSIPRSIGVYCLAISNDGRFLYSTGPSIFKRDAETGQLTPADALPANALGGGVRVQLSADGKYLATGGVVCKRDEETGGLSKIADVSDATTGPYSSADDASFSRDNRFLYTVSNNGVGVFQLEDEKITFVQSAEADDLKGLRAIVVSPDSHWVYAAGTSSNTLGVFRRDETSGKLESVQLLSDGQDGVTGLNGIFRLAVSGDGKDLYVSAGRFVAEEVISGFEVQSDGQLKLFQQFVNGADDFSEFEGANDIKVSADGKSVFAVASVSDRLFRFSRNLENGKLIFVASQQAGTFASPGAAALCFSPDGKFVYVGDEAEKAIEVYKLP
ncbi:MAG TPA: beta-propeller fold lactonase family protein [Chthoniobacteraceae bacterium]|jgi:6-phosphogluconolactonase (cycloisomerase 2 family)